MEYEKLKVKVGNCEFEAEGYVPVVQQAFATWIELIPRTRRHEMLIAELIEKLQQMESKLGPNTRVYFVQQESATLIDVAESAVMNGQEVVWLPHGHVGEQGQ